MFVGEYQMAFTGKGRIALPKKIREQLKGQTVVLTRGFDGCVAGYDEGTWRQQAEAAMPMSITDRENSAMRRFLFAGAQFVEIDEQGRVIIPENLLKHAAVAEKATIIGSGDHFEVWNTEKWNEYIKEIAQK